MSKRRKATLIVVCEDKRQKTFAYRFLLGMGWERHQIHFSKMSSGSGSGAKRVIETYPLELKIYRSRHVTCALVVIIDGDERGVEARMRQLNQECGNFGIPCRQKEEKVAFIVPTYSIETWIRFLQGYPVNEELNYKEKVHDDECKPSADRLVEYCKSTVLPNNAPSALRLACDEYRERIR